MLFQLALNTAMRLQECYTLELSQIALQQKTITLERTKNGDNRQVPLPSNLIPPLSDYISERSWISSSGKASFFHTGPAIGIMSGASALPCPSTGCSSRQTGGKGAAMTVQDAAQLAGGHSPKLAFDARLDGRSPDDLRNTFAKYAAERDPGLVRQGLRQFGASLMAQGLVGMQDYASLFGGHAILHLTVDGAGRFVKAGDGTCAQTLVQAYSRAKYGSIDDILLLAGMVSNRLSKALDDMDDQWRCMFERARADGDQVVMLTTGWRNVPSTANVLFDVVVERVNVKLAYLGLPTLIGVKLPRIAPPCGNYASLAMEERERISALHDHVLPARISTTRPEYTWCSATTCW